MSKEYQYDAVVQNRIAKSGAHTLNFCKLLIVKRHLIPFYQDRGRTSNGYIFRSIKKGGQVQSMALTDRSVANIVKYYAGKAGLTVDDFSAHSLRSGFITSGAAAGADLFKLMEVSRHKKPETVIGYIRESKLFEDHAGEKFL